MTSQASDVLLLIIRSLDVGGAQRQLVALANGLSRRGYDVVVAVFYGGGKLTEDLDRSHIQLIDLGKSGRWDLGRFSMRLVRLARDVRPAVVHGYLPGANLAATFVALFARGSRLVWGVRASDMANSVYGRVRPFVFMLTRILSRFPSLIIVNSEAGFRYHVKMNYPAARMTTIPNGINTAHFSPSPELGRGFRAELSVEESEVLLGFVGRFDPMKDLPTFLHVVALLTKENPGVRAVCVGEGTPDAVQAALDLVKHLELDEQVRFLGHRSDMRSVYCGMDVLCSTSRFGEGFPNVVGEAMACGTPCVVSDVGDSARIVRQSGIVVRPADPGAFAAGVEVLLGSLRDDPPTDPRMLIVDEFGIDRMVERTEALLWPVPDAVTRSNVGR